MKKIISILFLFVPLFLFSQTKLDSLVFEKINEYRISKGVFPLVWDTCSYKASKHHALYLSNMIFPLNGDMKILNYLSTCGSDGNFRWHLEDTIVKNFIDTVRTSDDRENKFFKYKNRDSMRTSNENIEMIGIYGDIQKASTDIVRGWINAKDGGTYAHRKNLLEKSCKYGSVCIINMNYNSIVAVFNSGFGMYFPKSDKKYIKIDISKLKRN